jgi:hypothetical protein
LVAGPSLQRLVLCALLPVVFLGSSGSRASAQEKPKGGILAFPSGEEWALGKGGPPDFLGVDIIRVHEGCLAFGGYFHSGRFFQGIKRTETPQGPVFRKAHRVVAQFPDKMDLIIDVSPGRCSKEAPTVASWEGEWPPEWIKAPHAEASLIRSLKAEPLEITLAEEGKIEGDSGIYSLLAYGLWEYRFRLGNKRVQFTDMMRFVLLSKSGEKLAELTYRP